MKLAGHGLSVDVPAGWEARITRRGSGPVLHVASFALLASDGDFGAAATGRMRPGDAFMALIEYVDPETIRPNVGLFAAHRPPAPRPRDFSPMQLQVTRPGQLGWQRFFSEQDRTCCLYGVISTPAAGSERIVKALAAVLGTLRFGSA